MIPFDRYSSYNHLKRITAWIFRFIECCRSREHRVGVLSHLSTEELVKADNYWMALSQSDHFFLEIESLKIVSIAPESSPQFVLHPFVDSDRSMHSDPPAAILVAIWSPALAQCVGENPVECMLIGDAMS